ncbi:hypothetical protein [Streptomyces sp. SID13588]|uniref:hypothetical protein n=1 Tax=Streptomyces sp. SID13588 TaxID=2706051 RepID=UPI0031B9C140
MTRSAFTSFSTAAWAVTAVPSWVGVGIGVAVRVGVGDGVVGRGVTGFRVGVTLGAGVVLGAAAEVGGVVGAAVDGLPPRVVVGLLGTFVRPVVLGEGEPVSGSDGPDEPSGWVRVPPGLPWAVMPPGPPFSDDNSPDDIATAPTARAADDASSPVRTALCRRRGPRWPRRLRVGATASVALRLWRPINAVLTVSD